MNQTPFYHLVPKDRAANLRFRREMIQLGNSDPAAAAELAAMCRRDILFYINTFSWTYDPRLPGEAVVVPFLTYECQDEAILDIKSLLGTNDIGIEKSRDMGASWICLSVFEHAWHFFEMQSFLMVSRVEDLVDKKDDPDCLFWKIDFILEHLPSWLRPSYNRQKLMLTNTDNGSTIAGASTTGETGRGGRRTAILFDEFASVEDGYGMLSASRDATDCRIFNSTPKGAANAFYDIMQTGIRKVRLHWSQHPRKAEGLYEREGKLRSPWYDKQCERTPHPAEIAQELDIDYLGSDYQYFSADLLDGYERKYACAPYRVGEFEFDDQTCEPHTESPFVDVEGGRLSLWMHLLGTGQPPPEMLGDCVIGADIATGTGASNSSLSIGCRRTGEKIGEFVSPNVRPEQLARIAVALSKWLGGALIIPEANGPGRNFIDAVREIDPTVRLYRRTDDRTLSRKISDLPGWYATRETKIALFGDYRRALADETFINRSLPALRECREIVYSPAGGVQHSRSQRAIDPSGARENHADRPTADALLCKGLRSAVRSSVDGPQMGEDSIAPAGSFAWRRVRAQQQAAKAALWLLVMAGGVL